MNKDNMSNIIKEISELIKKVHNRLNSLRVEIYAGQSSEETDKKIEGIQRLLLRKNNNFFSNSSKSTNIVVSYENSGSIAFVILCNSREKATDENILISTNSFFLNLYNEVKSRMEYSGTHSFIIVELPHSVIKLRWTFASSVNI